MQCYVITWYSLHCNVIMTYNYNATSTEARIWSVWRWMGDTTRLQAGPDGGRWTKMSLAFSECCLCREHSWSVEFRNSISCQTEQKATGPHAVAATPGGCRGSAMEVIQGLRALLMNKTLTSGNSFFSLSPCLDVMSWGLERERGREERTIADYITVTDTSQSTCLRHTWREKMKEKISHLTVRQLCGVSCWRASDRHVIELLSDFIFFS